MSDRSKRSFFFSSRRRHTISKRDWSSDVCSSDLCAAFGEVHALLAGPPGISAKAAQLAQFGADIVLVCRSEERRVGKECRSRRSPEHQKENGQSTRVETSCTQRWTRDGGLLAAAQ